MKKEITFKNFFRGYFYVFIILGLVQVILSLFNLVPIVVDGKNTYGILAAGLVLIYAFASVLIMATLSWIMIVIGLWLKDLIDNLLERS